MLLVMAVTLFALGAGGVAVGRQVAADRAFHPVRVPGPTPAPSGAAAALSALTAAPGAAQPDASPSATPGTPVAATAAGIAKAVAPLVRSPAFGGAIAAEVLDPTTSTALYRANDAAPVAPASTLKLLTAAATLTIRPPTDRIATTVVAGSRPGEVVLVGAGDPTLSAAKPGTPTPYDGAARISDLAAAVRKSLAGRPVSRIVVDGSLYSGADVAPGWLPEDIPSDFACRITAAMVDGGRDAPTDEIRSARPDLAAGRALAAALGAGSAPVVLGKAPATPTVLGKVYSAPMSRIVEQMLSESDNVLAESLGRHVAIADGKPASFAGAASAIADVLSRVGITVGSSIADTSGLSTHDRVPPQALAGVLVRAVGPNAPELRSILTGMPVAGWSGTLTNRYSDTQRNGRGVVRAKTGTLDGVAALAGIVTDVDGQTLVFVLVANRVPVDGILAADEALDAVAAKIATCGCRG